MKRLLTLLCLLPAIAWASPNLSGLVQLVDYIGVDYRQAVADGKVANPAEYGEMQDFAAAVVEQVQQLPPGETRKTLTRQANALSLMIAGRAAADDVSRNAASLRAVLIKEYGVVMPPHEAPNLQRARQLFTENCAACHGAEGRGDGALAAGMEPVPTDFHDAGRYAHRTLYGLYSTITHGVNDTPMRAFSQLSDSERWSLAFYVGQLAVSTQERKTGAELWQQGSRTPLAQLQTLTTITPAEAEADFGPEGPALMAYLRSQPQVLFAERSPLAFARDQIAASLAAYQAGDRKEAGQTAITAYLEGFELVEHGLDAVDPQLRRQVESQMTAYRNLIRKGVPVDAVSAQAATVQDLLTQSASRLDTSTLSGGGAFASAFIILVREGLEALLVVVALAAFLIKTGRRDGLPYLHYGWLGALAAGAVTWLGSLYLFDVSGANRELTEGIAAIVATVVLFYVGFWLHNKTHAQQWKRFIEGSVQKVLTRGTLWGLAGLSFVAVYREVFETILFYQALWVQADASAHGLMLGGIGTATVTLAVLAWLILRYSTRLPLRQFFAVTSGFMLVLAVVFAGKGVAALQEAGKLPINPVDFPRIDLLGIYPNLQSLLLQACLVSLAVVIFRYGSGRRQTA